MSNQDTTFELSRRKALAGLGTIGVASAGAGLGTSAFFSDTEEFQNNTLVAGELDMHVGWEEHYSDWSDDEAKGISSIEMVGPGQTANASRIGLPLDANSAVNGSMITVKNVSQARRFLNNTETSPTGTYSNTTNFDPATVSGDPCQFLADGADQSPVIIDLDDVKPGDFGEVTFSFALCTNPGYVWVNGDLQSAAENGQTEPEADDPDEKGGANESISQLGTGDNIELLDTVRAAMWYDDGDNLQSGGQGTVANQVDIVFVIDVSASIVGDESSVIKQEVGDLAQELASRQVDAQFALVNYRQNSYLDQDLTADPATIEKEIDDGEGQANTNNTTENLSDAILFANSNVSWRSGSTRVYVAITDELDQSSGSVKNSAASTLNGNGSAFLGISEDAPPNNEVQFLLNNVMKSEWADLDNLSTTQGSGLSGPLNTLVDFAQQVSGGEEVFFRGTLREALNALSPDPANGNFGIPLDGDTSSAYDELNDPADDPKRNCYTANTHHNLGFAWWLPVDHANEIQSDSATFKLGFYTEQCRHNDGSGQATS